MDQDLALAVFARWSAGWPVYESAMYKAAEAVGVNPTAALLEARYYTHLDRTLTKLAHNQVPTKREIQFVLAGAGWDQLEKTASAYALPPLPLALRTLEGRNWVPDLEKIALMMGQEQDPNAMPPQDPNMPPGEPSPEEMMGPQEGAQVQQQPGARFKPTPTAPSQIEPSEEGNIDAILAEAAQMQAQEQGGGQPPPGQGQDPSQGQDPAAQGQDPAAQGGQDPAMAGGEAPPPGGPGQGGPPPPDQKLLSVAPNLDPKVIGRYSEALTQLEQQVGMPVQDPKQLVKFIEAMQKADSKVIDQAIKDMADQQAQANMSPTLGAPKQFGQPGGGAGGGAQGPAQPQPQAGPPSPGGSGGDAMAKVASAAARIARARYRR